MDKKEIIKEIADIHNIIVSIPVHGDETILMAQAIIKTRDLIKRLKEEPKDEHGLELG